MRRRVVRIAPTRVASPKVGRPAAVRTVICRGLPPWVQMRGRPVRRGRRRLGIFRMRSWDPIGQASCACASPRTSIRRVVFVLLCGTHFVLVHATPLLGEKAALRRRVDTATAHGSRWSRNRSTMPIRWRSMRARRNRGIVAGRSVLHAVGFLRNLLRVIICNDVLLVAAVVFLPACEAQRMVVRANERRVIPACRIRRVDSVRNEHHHRLAASAASQQAVIWWRLREVGGAECAQRSGQLRAAKWDGNKACYKRSLDDLLPHRRSSSHLPTMSSTS